MASAKKSGFKLILGQYWHEVKKHPRFYIPILVLQPIGVFLSIFAVPYIVAQIIDTLSARGHVPLNEVWEVFGTLIILFISAILLSELVVWRVLIWLNWRLEMGVVYGLYQRCFNYLSGQSAKFHAERFGGSLVSQTNKFVGSYIRLADTVLFQLLFFVWGIVFMVAILWPRVPGFVISMLVICVLFLLVNFYSYNRMRHLSEKESEQNNKLSGHIADMITNVLAVKSFAAESREHDRFDRLNHKAIAATTKVMHGVMKRDVGFGAVLSMLMISMLLFIIFGQASLSVSIGTMILMLAYSMQLFEMLWEVMHMTRNFNKTYGDALPMAKVLQTEVVVSDAEEPEPVHIRNGAIAFEDVTFAHDEAGSNEALFKNFELNIKSGQKIGLVGHSGSGKTTLTKLLLRFMDIEKGAIKIDGQNIAHIAQADLREHIAYVPQEPLLFHRSLHENIAYSNPKATKKDVLDASKKAYADEFIQKLPNKYATLVGERGVKLSGGQRQRIAIARAILKDSPILLLDEATSALDSESEKLIQKALIELMRHRTTIVIAHRLSTIQKMDRIIVLSDGKIIEDGSHKKLLAKNGPYARLWAHQSGGFIEE